MRKFTPEEKELIINTPINRDCFGNCKRMSGWVNDDRTIFIIDQTEDYYFRIVVGQGLLIDEQKEGKQKSQG